MADVGFIGLGIMGLPMCRNLLKAGHGLVVYNRTRAKAEALAKEGAQVAESPREVAEKSEFVLLCVSDSPDVEEVVLGKNGVRKGAHDGLVVIDHSTVSPETARLCAQALGERGVDFLDAPISGGEEGAIHAKLAIMVGGPAEVFERARPVLECLGKTITHVGDTGAGQVTKAVNQILVGSALLAIAEGFTLAQRSGVDPARVIEAIAGGAAGSWILSNRGLKMIAADYKPGFKCALHNKDLRLANEAAAASHTNLKLAPLVYQALQSLVDSGKGDFDHTALKLFVENMQEE